MGMWMILHPNSVAEPVMFFFFLNPTTSMKEIGISKLR